jgi:hypothetical protein
MDQAKREELSSKLKRQVRCADNLEQQEGKETHMKKSIGFIGLGQMGRPIAFNLLKAGFALRVFDLQEERQAPLVVRGASQVVRLGDVIEAGGIVLTMVPDERVLLQVSLGEGGILRRIGQGGIHLSLSTVSPEVAAQLAKLYEHQGSHYLTPTVLGGPEEVEAAQLLMSPLETPLPKYAYSHSCGPLARIRMNWESAWRRPTWSNLVTPSSSLRLSRPWVKRLR